MRSYRCLKVAKKTKTFEPFDWSKVPSYTKEGKMIIDSADVFERVIKKIAKETGSTIAEVMDTINEEVIVTKEVFNEVYERLFG